MTAEKSYLKNNVLETTLSSVPAGADALELVKLSEHCINGIMHIAIDDRRMVNLANEIRFFATNINVIELPAWDCLPYDRISPSVHIANKRAESLCEIASKKSLKNNIIITTVNSLLQKTTPKEILSDLSFSAKSGDEVNRDDLINHLVKSGYSHSHTANEAGEFSVRGSIIDILPSGSEMGLRLDFFGETLESIKEFDPLTQISGNKTNKIKLLPASEIILDEKTINNFRNNYRKLFGLPKGDDPLYGSISEGRKYAGMEHWLPLFYDKTETVFNYLPDVTISFEHLANEAIHERIELIEDYYHARHDAGKSAFSEGATYHPIPHELLYLSEDDLNAKTAACKVINFNPFAVEGESENIITLPYKPAPQFHIASKANNKNSFELLKEELQERKLKSLNTKSAGVKNIIACMSEGSRNRMKSMMLEHEFNTVNIDSWADRNKAKGKVIGLMVLELERGFSSDEFFIIAEQDILGERISSKKTRKRSENFLTEAESLSEGELVVHKEYGLGRFEALETIQVAGKSHDCLRILYQVGDKIYVPVENIDTLTRYGSESEVIKLDKLGSTAWQGRKAALKNRIKIIAEDLIKTAAERQLHKAPELLATEGLYDEFCARFPYAETDDQLRAIEDVCKDLSSGKPMDRLICGDVGFGKTEVALRAAFIAASNNDQKQVAIIAPTTLLCRQHAKTFKERFAGFPFEVRDLSRLTPPKLAKENKQLLAEGKVDIIVGTHSLIAKSLKFKNLGLVIIDEEQQFGVAQKERFKQVRSDVHVLSLSATPIPRTMQMSLTGIKDLSIIATPPVDRLSIRSFTMPFDSVVIRNAILREHYRGGSTFFVVPRIKDLEEVTGKIRDLVPEVKITTAHGQTSPAQLDQTMTDFYDGKYDVLISTNIIGSGIDMPTANTVVVYKAHLFGLSQLYQMRGRVGRSKTRAYAYFTIPPKKVPSKTAIRRLEVIQNIDSLGAGFSVASHDMDIRGFGNMLGDEQSGQIKEVGVELYQHMLQEAIANAKAQAKDGDDADIIEDWSPNINLGISVLIPENYIADIELRLAMYRRIANLETADDVEAIAVEMIDRFGKLPEEVNNLLEIMKIKQKCLTAGIDKLDLGPKGMVLSFRNNTFKNPDALISYISKNPLKTKLKGDMRLVIMQQFDCNKDKIEKTNKALDRIIGLI